MTAVVQSLYDNGRRSIHLKGQSGILIFKSIAEALRAGYMIESPVPDSEGHIHARIRTPHGWAKALVRITCEAR